MLMHILSPYAVHRSALTDCSKLLASGFAARLGVLIYGFESVVVPLEPAIAAFELLANARAALTPRASAKSGLLVHPIHSEAMVFGWELSPR
jgi:hypothetical protein